MFEFAKSTMAGLLTGLFCVGLGVVLHACTAGAVQAQATPETLETAAEMAASAEVMRVKAEYEALSVESKMEGIVYE